MRASSFAFAAWAAAAAGACGAEPGDDFDGGVLQFGPQKLKEKDQVFLYLNRKSSIMDTTSSCPGYHQVDPERNYPIEQYSLATLSDVEVFWHR